MSTPINIIGGFLGAGKTTAIQGFLAALGSKERVAIIVNDFGEASIDAATLASAEAATVKEIAGGCVCCTAPEGFSAAVGQLLDDVRPDRILIEPTGLARPADLVDTLARGPHRDRLTIGPTIVLIDPTGLSATSLAAEPLLQTQAEAADVLVANRVDLADEADIARFEAFAESLWPGPLRTLQTRHGAIDAAALAWPEGEGRRSVPMRIRRVNAPSTAGFSTQSWSWAPDVVFSRKRVDQLFAELIGHNKGARVARAKAVFRTNEGVLRVDIAGGQVHLRDSVHRRDSRLDLILHGASPPSGTWPRISGALDAVICSARELEHDRHRVEISSPDGGTRSVDRLALAALPDGIADVSTIDPKRQGAAARISALVDAFQLPRAGEVVVVAADGFVSPPVPVAAFMNGVLLHSLDGAPLPPSKGGPIRLLIPGEAGPAGPCSNVKAVVRVVFR
jgi:G3E family GTPase